MKSAVFLIALLFAVPAVAEESGADLARRCLELTREGRMDDARIVCDDPVARASLLDLVVAMTATSLPAEPVQQARGAQAQEQLLAEDP